MMTNNNKNERKLNITVSFLEFIIVYVFKASF